MEQQQEKSTQDKYAFSSFPLYEHKTPEFREKVGSEFFWYGDDNLYPDYLVYLYNRSSVHNAIIDGKVRFILGNGWTTQSGDIKKLLLQANRDETFDEVSRKALLDRRIFGGYALKIVWFAGKISSIYHVPFHKVRVSIPTKEIPKQVYFVSNEWSRNDSTKANFKAVRRVPTDAKTYEPFNPLADKKTEQLFYVVDYRPQTNIYPLPEYMPCNAAIETDIEIDNFHLNNIKTGFAAGKMITLKNGVPSPEEKAKIEKDIKNKVSGTDNAGEILVNFSEPNGDAPEVTDLRSNELDKQYEQLSRDTRDKIFVGHSVVSPLLFGVKTEGQLGGRNELDLAWQLMNINYIEPKRKEFEQEMNTLVQLGGYNGTLELKPLNRLGIEFSEATVKELVNKDQLRQLLGDQLGIKIEPPTPVAPAVTPVAQSPVKMDKDKIDFDSILINEFSKIGIPIDSVEFASDTYDEEQKLLAYLKDKKSIDIDKASKELKIDVAAILKKLIENNVVSATINENNVKIEKIHEIPEPSFDVVTMWKYEWNNPSDANDIENSRDFCRRLLKLGKLYTREEIDNLNNEMKDFNTDVWKYRGGWRTLPNTDGLVHVPSCRHYFKPVFVKKPR